MAHRRQKTTGNAKMASSAIIRLSPRVNNHVYILNEKIINRAALLTNQDPNTLEHLIIMDELDPITNNVIYNEIKNYTNKGHLFVVPCNKSFRVECNNRMPQSSEQIVLEVDCPYNKVEFYHQVMLTLKKIFPYTKDNLFEGDHDDAYVVIMTLHKMLYNI